MALTKLNNKAVANITTLPVALGDMVFISSQTASSSASISFTTGIDSTYKEYQFYFINIHPATDSAEFQFQCSTNGGSTYATTATTTYFVSYHNEADTDTGLVYDTGGDLAQSTSFQNISYDTGNGNDESSSGVLKLFNPSSTTYVKHFISECQWYNAGDYCNLGYSAGYFNTTSAINAIQFKYTSGNIDDGTILMFGIK